MSRFSAIETSGLAQLATVTALLETRAVASGMLSSTRPSQFPAAFFTILDAKRTIGDAVVGHTLLEYVITAGVLIFASDDGSQVGGARTSVWTILDSVMDAFTNWTPTGFSAGTTPYPCIPGDPVNTEQDTGQACIWLPLEFRFIWST